MKIEKNSEKFFSKKGAVRMMNNKSGGYLEVFLTFEKSLWFSFSRSSLLFDDFGGGSQKASDLDGITEYHWEDEE